MNRKALYAAAAFFLAGTLAAGPLAIAQQAAPFPPPPAHNVDPHHQAMRLAKELSLTPDQTAKLEPILADRDQKLTAIRTDTTLDPRTAKKQMRAIQLDTQQQLGSVLTADQLRQMQSLKHDHGTKNQAQPSTPPTA